MFYFLKMADQYVNIKGGEFKARGCDLFQVGEFVVGQEQLD